MKACPYRKDFYAKLASDPDGGVSVTATNVDEELNKWLGGLDKIISEMRKVYKEKGYGDI